MEFLPLLLLLLFGCGRQLSSAGLLDYGGQTLGSDPLLQQPYDLLYAGGLREYHQYHWAKAVSLLERALLSHSALRRLRTRCQRLCVQQDPGGNSWDPLDSLQFFQSLLHRAACLQHCVTASLGQQSRHMVTETVQADFQRRTPYNYLQLIYYRLEQLDKAAAAAQTFFEANPDHQEMQENLEKYRQMEGVKEEDFKDLEAQPHWVSYREGMELHQAEQFAESIPRLEAAIREYMAELSECRAQCEGWYHPPDYAYLEYQSHLYEAISDHYVQVLGCSQDCVRELATKPGSGKTHKNFLPSHFYLLQSAYHKVGNYEKAVECSRTFLLFQPEDGSVCQNLEYYQSKLPAGRADEILPREDIKLHINESLLQKQMLYVAMESLGVPFNDPDSWTPAELIPQSLQGKRRPESSESPPDSPEIDTMQGKPLEIVTQINDDIQLLRASSSLFANLKVLMDSNQLSGNQRVVFDGVLTPEECAAIRSLANAATDLGTFSVSGSSTRLLSKHPETLTILRALKFAHEGLLRPDYAQLYYQASERARAVVQAHFRSKSPLHPSFSWLGCHTAQAGGSETGDAPRIAVQGGECLRNPEDAACWTEAVANPASEFR
ncbi:prolyl 3-hydroxylase 1-like isoform X2 [Scyliorhinus canicula]|uniref:prolyl 3-hydroxylase 1-like isoform X2 n=1 Tax=Scyliorhinus canicula TaxID=7830 RepID=UPI0018F32A5E|nr:prolyl 3-hydroxylase 1-like isoform X2 [Scyliorhinus canicula]